MFTLSLEEALSLAGPFENEATDCWTYVWFAHGEEIGNDFDSAAWTRLEVDLCAADGSERTRADVLPGSRDRRENCGMKPSLPPSTPRPTRSPVPPTAYPTHSPAWVQPTLAPTPPTIPPTRAPTVLPTDYAGPMCVDTFFTEITEGVGSRYIVWIPPVTTTQFGDITDYQLWVRECEADENFCSRNAHSDQGDFASVVTISKADAEEEGVFSGFDGTDGYFVSQCEWGLETGKVYALDVRAQDDAGVWGPWDHGTFNMLGASVDCDDEPTAPSNVVANAVPDNMDIQCSGINQ